MSWTPHIKRQQGKEYILCEWRQKWVRLTAEEWVRQHILHSLVEDYGIPKQLIAVEYSIEVGECHKRCDAVVMTPTLSPQCIIEFKADDVALTQKVFDQVAVYNRTLHVPYCIISNGKQLVFFEVTKEGYRFLDPKQIAQQHSPTHITD